jgi:uncharacterized protein YprB with RNaseH-like and TPR domain
MTTLTKIEHRRPAPPPKQSTHLSQRLRVLTATHVPQTPPTPKQPLQFEQLARLLPGSVDQTPHGICYRIHQAYGPNAIHGDRRLGDLTERECQPTEDLTKRERQPTEDLTKRERQPTEDLTKRERQPTEDLTKRECQPTEDLTERERQPTEGLTERERKPPEAHGDSTNQNPHHCWTALLAEDPQFTDFDPRRAVFFDLETTGLSVGMGTLPFLIGAAHWHQGQWILEQWLLRTPDEEAAALHALAARLADAEWAVSFNGRTYDAPLLAARYQGAGLPNPFEGLRGHLDLLPISRRLLKESLPNCRLGSIEVGHLGLRRINDVPGSAVPACYRAWLAGGDARALVGVVVHNRDDILSMVTLLDLLLRRAASAPSLVLRTPKAALRLAKAAERLHPQHALAIYTVAAMVPETEKRGRLGLRRLKKRGVDAPR